MNETFVVCTTFAHETGGWGGAWKSRNFASDNVFIIFVLLNVVYRFIAGRYALKEEPSAHQNFVRRTSHVPYFYSGRNFLQY